ncbi:FAD-binding oxidoreductase [Metabacillus idriensis]|nr:FAD-binding oxidoreductase [Metabacillus idriensis]MCM3596573.1 FAD-binding oxidoreductase [Metabacillus idriensis]
MPKTAFVKNTTDERNKKMFRKEKIGGWGNYPIEECFVYRPENLSDLRELVEWQDDSCRIPRGNGRSYGDTALNGGHSLLLLTKFNRFLSFDSEKGILECEGGTMLEEIIEFFLPRGYFLPVTPGTKFVTLGGAIANDVHGKNHHRGGCLSEHILDFKLLTASGEILTCSRVQNKDLFWATAGGIGLTGIILSARIRLIQIESAMIDVDYLIAKNLEEAFELFRQHDHKYDYSVAWIDCLAAGETLGRSILMLGNHSPRTKINSHSLETKSAFKWNVPASMPPSLLNPLTIKGFNQFYYSSFKDGSHKTIDYNSYFYPLDSILNWNRLYGKKGFVQYQAVFPEETSMAGLTEMLKKLSESQKASFLAVLKSFGTQNEGLLSFPFKGHTLALDFPVKDGTIFPFLKELDELVLRYNGRIYLAKDSVLDPRTFEAMYPDLDKFKKIKKEIDPKGIFSSSMSRRLAITGDCQ